MSPPTIPPASSSSSGSSEDLPTPPPAGAAPNPAPTGSGIPASDVQTPASPRPCSDTGRERGVSSNFCTEPRTDTYFQAVGLDANFGESWWLGGYDAILGGRSLFWGPEESRANLRLNLHWGSGRYNVFNSLNFANGVTQGTPDFSINRFDLEGGLVNYAGYMPLVGRRGEGFYLGFRGMTRAGAGLGLAFFSGGPSDQTHSPMFQFRPISDGDHLTLGVGRFEMGIRLFESNTAFTAGGADINRCTGTHCAESDLFPVSSMRGPVFSLRYYINPPYVSDVLPTHLDDADFAYRMLDLNMSRFGALVRNRSDANIIETMGILQGWPLGLDASRSSYGAALTSLFLTSAYNGISAGGEASDLEDTLRRGNWTQRGIALGGEAAWLLGTGIGWATRPAYPTPEAFARGERGALDSPYGNAARMMFPRLLLTDGLATLGALGVFGSETPISADGRSGGRDAWFHVANSILALGGLSLVLFARPISGNGTPPDTSTPGRPQSWLPYSILGDYSGTFEGARSVDLYRWNGGDTTFYDAKQNEVLVTELGFALLAYPINRWLRPTPRLSDGDAASGGSGRPVAADTAPRFNVGLNGSREGFMLRLDGQF